MSIESDSNRRHISHFRAPYDYSLISYSFDNQMYSFAAFDVIIVIARAVRLVTWPGVMNVTDL